MGDAADTATNVAVVQEFLNALERLDIERALDLLTDDVVYQNVPFPPARGKQAVAQQLRGLGRYATGFEARNHNIVGRADVVLTERTDVITVGRVRAAFWVCGTFELREGRISLWRDRFDFVDLGWAMLRGAVAAVLPRRG